MSQRDPLARLDGFTGLKGVDSASAPHTLPRDRLAWMVNGTQRGGVAACRPGFKRFTLAFTGEDGVEDPALETAFCSTGLFQGAAAYLDDRSTWWLLALVGGILYRIDLSLGTVLDLTAGDTALQNAPTLPRAWFAQAENYLIAQNASDAALIYDGATLRRSEWPNGIKEVPTGSSMAASQGRLWIASPDGSSFFAGDLAWSDGSRAAILGFTENEFLTAGSFAVPGAAGPITAMQPLAQQDTSTGQGPLQVFTSLGAFSVSAPFDREQWQSFASPIQTVSLLGSGASGAFSTLNVNGDIWFRAPDGVRSFMAARREQGTWTNTPLSEEMLRAFFTDTGPLLEYGSAALFDNRLFFTCAPSMQYTGSGTERRQRGVGHLGLGVLDFDSVSGMLQRDEPRWDGIWTGLTFLQVISAGPRAFAFSLNASGLLELWEFTTSATVDGSANPIEWFLETPSYGFEDEGWRERRLSGGRFWLYDLAGNAALSFYYRPDEASNWQTWASAAFCAPVSTCPPYANCAFPSTLQPQHRASQRLPEPGLDCLTETGKPAVFGTRFAARIEATGSFKLRQFSLMARDVPEELDAGCPPSACAAPAGVARNCAFYDYSYTIPEAA